MTTPPARRRAAMRVFAIPALLAILMAGGLIAGLLGDGIWDATSWIALAVPLALIVWRTLKLPWPGGARARF
jgi:hypothetical protein